MGACIETIDNCKSKSCSGHEVDIIALINRKMYIKFKNDGKIYLQITRIRITNGLKRLEIIW